MFTGITLKNYKSLFDFSADFTKGRVGTKNMILIYGENGIGKSCFVDAFYTLHQLLFTRTIREKFSSISDNESTSFMKKYLGDRYDIIDIINENKSIGSTENMIMQFDFILGDKKGTYIVETNDEKLLYERLDFAINKNLVNIFELSSDNRKVTPTLFADEEYSDYMIDNILKYWGKHTFLSLLNFELEDKNNEYINNQFSKYLMQILKFFNTVSVRVKRGNWGETGLFGTSSNILKKLEYGIVKISDEKRIDDTEKLLSCYLSLLNSDVKRAYYKREYLDNEIKYQLYLEKRIYDRIVNIDFKKESTGNQNLLYLLPFFISALEGNVIVIDEFDNGIHDLLTEKLILELFDVIGFKGQAIITTHNTRLMESDISKDLMFVLQYENSKKILKPFNEIVKIQKNNNVRKIYCSGDLGGIPDVDLTGMNKLLDKLNRNI